MERDELLEQGRGIISRAKAVYDELKKPKSVFPTQVGAEGIKAEVIEFLSSFGSPKNAFLQQAVEANSPASTYKVLQLISIMESFINYSESGLFRDISAERKAQLDVVSDFLEQANTLLEAKGVHPASAAVLIGATLEEFLRTWVEAEELSLGNRKPGLESYSQILREAELISKQDGKDITSWAGIRNHAAHGEWDEVSDKKRIQLMLEGVNLFMRKYSP